MINKLLIDLFDYTGNTAEPYRKAGWHVKQVDKKHGQDLLDWDFVAWFNQFCVDNHHHAMPQVGIIAMIPCTAYALSGNRHKKTPQRIPVFEESQKLCARVKQIIDFFDNIGILDFWMVENPASDIHTHNPWLGEVKQKFNPCDFAGYDPIPDNSRYNKQTWLWGKFRRMAIKRMEPFEKSSPIWKRFGGKSEKTKEARSITPLGFAYAFFEANN